MTFDKQFTRQSVNADELSSSLGNEFGRTISGVSTVDAERATTVIVHFYQEPSSDQVERAQQILEAHDASVQSPHQKTQEMLEQLRLHYGTNLLDVESFDPANQQLRTLAEYIAWLQKEILNLVGGDG